MPGDVWVTTQLMIPEAALVWRFTTSGGPGGQHANKAATRVEVDVALEDITGMTDTVRSRLAQALGTTIRAAADDHRSQVRNRALAEERLAAKIRAALVVRPPRRPTKPTKGSQRRRVAAKRQRSQLKSTRSRIDFDE